MESIHNYLIYLRMQHCRKALEEEMCIRDSPRAGEAFCSTPLKKPPLSRRAAAPGDRSGFVYFAVLITRRNRLRSRRPPAGRCP